MSNSFSIADVISRVAKSNMRYLKLSKQLKGLVETNDKHQETMKKLVSELQLIVEENKKLKKTSNTLFNHHKITSIGSITRSALHRSKSSGGRSKKTLKKR